MPRVLAIVKYPFYANRIYYELLGLLDDTSVRKGRFTELADTPIGESLPSGPSSYMLFNLVIFLHLCFSLQACHCPGVVQLFFHFVLSTTSVHCPAGSHRFAQHYFLQASSRSSNSLGVWYISGAEFEPVSHYTGVL
jgi:hypothetical protein